ncbi:MBL fold metallo-hydrolase [Enterococcus saccharolyticus]|uniref:MBL fold metallo-hydrolase n=1 Tax=Enterococcus saccharolyticus TaxID=41997 RepID=UPI0039DFF8EF
MIKVTIFGSGSKGNGYLIDDGHSQLILEAGVPFRAVQEKMNHNFTRLAGVLITHEHRDHCKYVRSFVDKVGADIYATKGTIDAMFQDAVLGLKFINRYRFRDLTYRDTVKIGTWFVTAFETKHDVAEPCGFLIDTAAGDRLIFITDSYYVKYKFPRITHMMVEANYSEEIIESKLSSDKFSKKLKTRIKGSHFDLANTIEFVKANKNDRLQEIHLIHLSDSNSHAKQFKGEVQKVSGVPVYIA